MIDLREATDVLSSYSASIVGKSRLYNKMQNLAPHDGMDKDIEGLIADLNAATRDAMIISIVIMRAEGRLPKQIFACFANEIAELSKALSHCHVAIEEASKATLTHEEKSRRKDSTDSPIVKALEEFRKKHGYRSN